MKNNAEKTLHQLFKSEQFHYQALRALGHEVYGGALAGEVLTIIGNIKNNDTDAWSRQWHAMGKRCEEEADRAGDARSKGYALLRASNYIRASEFFMDPAKGKRRDIYNESVQDFEKGISHLGIQCSVWHAPYEQGKMRIYYFPGDEGKPLIIMFGGYDSTNEESYFWGGAAAIERGYPLVMFEGPGQSGMIREHGIRFTHEWHKPLSAVIDYMEKQDPRMKNKKKILFGISLGGLLAGRAAAYEKRISGLVMFGAPFDMGDAAMHSIPRFARYLSRKNWSILFNAFAQIKMRLDLNTRWKCMNGMWTIGGGNPYELFNNLAPYTLQDVAGNISCDVLILSGDNDIYAAPNQENRYKQTIVNARSITYHAFRRECGSAEHCQAGAVEQAMNVFFSWIIEIKF